jgi:hypothetical protein
LPRVSDGVEAEVSAQELIETGVLGLAVIVVEAGISEFAE